MPSDHPKIRIPQDHRRWCESPIALPQQHGAFMNASSLGLCLAVDEDECYPCVSASIFTIKLAVYCPPP